MDVDKALRLVAEDDLRTYARATAIAKTLADEVERLRLTDDKLLKTADNISVTPGMEVYSHSMASGWLPNKILGMFVLQGVWWLGMARGPKLQPGDCYSTREATEADTPTGAET